MGSLGETVGRSGETLMRSATLSVKAKKRDVIRGEATSSW